MCWMAEPYPDPRMVWAEALEDRILAVRVRLELVDRFGRRGQRLRVRAVARGGRVTVVMPHVLERGERVRVLETAQAVPGVRIVHEELVPAAGAAADELVTREAT